MQRLKAMIGAAPAMAGGGMAPLPHHYPQQARRFRQPGPPQPAGAKLSRRAAAGTVGKALMRRYG